MAIENHILIKNIYYMLTYAFRVLNQTNYESVAGEDFEKIDDLFAAIIARGVARQLKQGLYREYETRHETLALMRGKLDIEETIRLRMQHKHMLASEFDELSKDNLFNRILKTTMHYLEKADGVSQERRDRIRKELVYFDGIGILDPSAIKWSSLRYHRNNADYEMLMNLCYFVLDRILLTTENGEYRMAAFTDEHLARLYEKFILEYYRQNHQELAAKSAEIKWNLSVGNDESLTKFLPSMQSDVFLKKGDKTLILDAKYYRKTMQTQYDKSTLHSNNLYQIYTYVKNQDRDNTGKVSGMLVYAKTDEEITPNCEWNMGGNRIGAVTLDLNTDFNTIASQLDNLVSRFL
jgi:McrBC 5-methylcytosine restriction system component